MSMEESSESSHTPKGNKQEEEEEEENVIELRDSKIVQSEVEETGTSTTTTTKFASTGEAGAEADAEEEENGTFTFKLQLVPKKSPFKFKKNNNGNILSIHHTVNEGRKLIRIRLGVCCFSERCIATKFVTIDKRGNVFVFNLTDKLFWKLSVVILKASVILPSKSKENEYIVGTKAGQLLLIDIERSLVLRAGLIAPYAITELSFLERKVEPKHLALVHAGSLAIIVNLLTFTATHRLDFDEGRLMLKFASFIPQTEQIFTCFANDTIHIWSSVTLKTVQVVHPIKSRNRKLSLTNEECLPAFKLGDICESGDLDFIPCEAQNFSEGLITDYCFSTQNGGLLCLATMDKFLTLFSSRTFEVTQNFRLLDFFIKKCEFLPQGKQILILALTTFNKVVILDCQCTEYKLIINLHATNISVSPDGKLLAVLAHSGEADVWTTGCIYSTLKSQQECMLMLKEAFKQPKPLIVSPTNDNLNEELKNLLQRDRLIAILKEYGFYPAKYRNLIWCALLKLPSNRREFQKLLQMKIPTMIRQRADKMPMKNESLKRSLINTWSCLANWCQVFAYSDFLPYLIFPFIKVFPRNSLVAFEVCATLILNHFQLWFEFHPLIPTDYLSMCENVLQHFDPQLKKFYATNDIEVKDYAWPLLSTGFSEVLNQEQWLILWDNIISCPIYFPIFCVIAYNILEREVILLLPDHVSVENFFREENPIDIRKLVEKSLDLMNKCPENRHPRRYFKDFHPIPKNVYPKFLRYPREWVAQHEEELTALQREQAKIDAQIHQLELNERIMAEELKQSLKKEEHAKRLKEMEQLYYNAIKKEEERLAFQRKILLLYQKQVRDYKSQILTNVQESERRKRLIETENQLDMLMHSIERERNRNDSAMILAEDQLRNQSFELLFQEHYKELHTETPNLAKKFQQDISRLSKERAMLRKHLNEFTFSKSAIEERCANLTLGSTNLSDIERKLDDIQKEFVCLTKRNVSQKRDK